ncbi:MAG: hypothetical protein H0V82_01265 [Candidatus Protochlamydia sp.]|nr:hypothetical protein [Candidatus Protochlamydia sp.]
MNLIPPIFTNNLNLNQTEDVLKELTKLNVIGETGHDIYMASKNITTAPSDFITQRIRNYLSTWTGWSTNLYYLPALTKQVVKFVKSEEGQKIPDDLIMSAIEGLSVLLFVKGPNDENRPYIDEALEDLLRALGVMKMNEQTNPPPLMHYLWHKSGSFLPHLSISSVVTHVSEKACYLLGYRNENPLFKTASEKIKQFIFLNTVENDIDFKNAIKSFFHDKKLTAIHTVQISDHQFMDVPSQFYIDCSRSRTVAINDKVIFDLDKADSSSSNYISQAIEKEFGSPIFLCLGSIIHQSLIADQVVKWFKKDWPIEWYESDSPFQQSFITQADGFHFTINEVGEEVHIKAKIILKFAAVVNETIIEKFKLSTNDKQEIGYIVIDRFISVRKDELLNKLEVLSEENMLPSLSVKQTTSDFFPTMQEASNFLKNV